MLRLCLFVLPLTLMFLGGDSSFKMKASLRGVHNLKNGVIWASGSEGAILRSVDNGSVWQPCSIPPDAEKLDFRGIRAFDKNRAVAMSSGPGAASRLYETTDGCHSWRLLFANSDPAGFWDAIAFHGETGVLLGDPVDGRFVIYRTSDGGRRWIRDQSAALTAHPKGEGAFAASNSALVIRPDGKKILFGTGGPGGPRIFMSDLDASGNWTVADLPWTGSNDAAGIFSLAFRDGTHGVAVGGDYKSPANRDRTAVFTSDGGARWQAASAPPGGYRSSVDWDQRMREWIAVGPNGSDISKDDGRTWRRLDSADGNALSLPWVVGSHGRIARLRPVF